MKVLQVFESERWGSRAADQEIPSGMKDWLAE